MRIVGSSFTALSASYLTWYWLEDDRTRVLTPRLLNTSFPDASEHVAAQRTPEPDSTKTRQPWVPVAVELRTALEDALRDLEDRGPEDGEATHSDAQLILGVLRMVLNRSASVTEFPNVSVQTENFENGEQCENGEHGAVPHADHSKADVDDMPSAFEDLVVIGSRSTALLRDVATHLTSSFVDLVWQWPVDADHHTPEGSSLGTELASWIPPEIKSDAELFLGMLAIPAGALRSGVRSMVDQFLDHFPHHRAALGDRDPMLVPLVLLAVLHITIWEVYGCWRVVLFFVRRILCRCCFERAPSKTVPPRPRSVVKRHSGASCHGQGGPRFASATVAGSFSSDSDDDF